MKRPVVEAFLCGVTLGIGMTVLSLYTQRPACIATMIEATGEMGRARKAKKENEKIQRERLRAAGFSDEEIDEVL